MNLNPVQLPEGCGRIDIGQCLRCGGNHKGLLYFKFRKQGVRVVNADGASFTAPFWTTCPSYYEPILVYGVPEQPQPIADSAPEGVASNGDSPT